MRLLILTRVCFSSKTSNFSDACISSSVAAFLKTDVVDLDSSDKLRYMIWLCVNDDYTSMGFTYWLDTLSVSSSSMGGTMVKMGTMID